MPWSRCRKKTDRQLSSGLRVVWTILRVRKQALDEPDVKEIVRTLVGDELGAAGKSFDSISR